MRRAEPLVSPFLLMGLIFFLSAQPDLNSGLGTIDLVGRKVVHALLYAALLGLWWRALVRTGVESRPALMGALAITLAYAISDEYHQTFVHGREGSPLDVVIDLAGTLAAAAVIRERAR